MKNRHSEAKDNDKSQESTLIGSNVLQRGEQTRMISERVSAGGTRAETGADFRSAEARLV